MSSTRGGGGGAGVGVGGGMYVCMFSTTRNPFIKGFLDLPKFFIEMLFIALFLSGSSRVFAVYKIRRWI
jgi:hypothetical protein